MYREDAKIRVKGTRFAGVIIKDSKILLMHRIKKGREYYVFPGGHRRINEKNEEAVIREVEEETSIKVTNPKLAFEFPDGKYKNIHRYYLCTWTSGDKPKLIGEEAVRNNSNNFYEPIWIDINRFSSLNVLPKLAKKLTEEILKSS